MISASASASTNRPVLVMGWIPRIVLPIARSVHQHEVPVDLVSFLPAPRIASRAIREFRNLPRPDIDRPEFITQLRQFITDRGHDMLIPTDDCTLAAVVEHYDDLADLLHVACPPPAITRLVLEKMEALKIAQRCGIDVPRTVVVRKSSELHDLIGSFPFPWVIKPARKETRLEEVKSHVLTGADQVRTKFPVGLKFTPSLLVQEYCEGVGIGVEMLVHGGECLAVFQHRRLKEMPYTGGVSVTAVSEAPKPTLVQSSLALLRALQWEGVAMVEYKTNPGGRTVLMEVNGRYWGTISLPISAGMNFPLHQWQLVHGERPDVPNTYAVGMKWRWTVGYLDRLYTVIAKARYSCAAREALRRTLWDMPVDFAPWVTDSTLTLWDPIPSIADFLRVTRYLASYSVKRAFQKQTPMGSVRLAAPPASLIHH